MSDIHSIVSGEKAYPMKSKQVFTVYFEGVYLLWIRAEESESLKVGKSLKIGKNWIKSEKSDLISFRLFGKNAKMP